MTTETESLLREFYETESSIKIAAGLFLGLLVTAGVILPAESTLGLFGISELSGIYSDSDPTVVSIFRNNVGLSSIVALGGFTLGLLSIGILVHNGLVLGSALQLVAGQHGLDVILLGILPHGLFEIPAIILAGAVGIDLGRQFARWVFRGGDPPSVADIHRYAYLFGVSVLLMGIAAVVEMTVSKWLLYEFAV